MGAVLLTQAQARNDEHAARLAADGIETRSWPLQTIVPTRTREPDLGGVDALVVTSAHAVSAFAQLSARRDLPLLAVGDSTAAAARSAGFDRVASASGDAGYLVRLVDRSPYRRLAYLRGRDISTDLAGAIGGGRVAEVVLYAAEPAGPPPAPILSALQAGRFAAITVWSRRNGEILAGHIDANPDWPMGGTKLVAISENAANPLGNAGFQRVCVPARPDACAMLALLRDAAAQEKVTDQDCAGPLGPIT